MEQDSQELENLKKRLFQKEKQKPDEIAELRAVMREVGGYEQLLHLPISAYKIIAESIAEEKQKEMEAYEKAKSHSKH